MSGTLDKIVLGDKSPIIFTTKNTQIEVSQAIQNYLEYARYYDEYQDYYAITLTIPKNDADKLKNEKFDIIGYFKDRLLHLKINGIWIVEHTKKGVEHLHGVVYTKQWKDIPNKRILIKKTYSYTKEIDYPFHHVVKTLPSKRAMTGWHNYMIKHCIHKTVVEYMSKGN